MDSRPRGHCYRLPHHAAHCHAERYVYGQHGGSIEHTGRLYRGHHHRLLCRRSRYGRILSHRTQDTGSSFGQIVAAHRPYTAILSQLVLCPPVRYRTGHHCQFHHRLPERFPHAVDHPPHQVHLQSQGHPQRVLCLLLSAGIRKRTTLDGHHRPAGRPLRLEIYVLLHDAATAGCHTGRHRLFPPQPPLTAHSLERAARTRDAHHRHWRADAHLRHHLWQDTRLDGLHTHPPLYRRCPATGSHFPVGTVPFTTPLCQPETAFPMESHRGLLLYDDGDVFQHIHQPAHQLPHYPSYAWTTCTPTHSTSGCCRAICWEPSSASDGSAGNGRASASS